MWAGGQLCLEERAAGSVKAQRLGPEPPVRSSVIHGFIHSSIHQALSKGGMTDEQTFTGH